MSHPVSPESAPRTNHRITIVVLLVVVALAVVLIGNTLGIVGVLGRQPFHDTLGLFSTTVPDGWKVTKAPNTYGDENYLFQDEQKGNTSAYVRIEVVANQ